VAKLCICDVGRPSAILLDAMARAQLATAARLKHFCRVAARYGKLAAHFLAIVQLVSVRLGLRAYESMTQNEPSRG